MSIGIGTIRCEHCGSVMGSFRDGRLKIKVKTRLIAVREDGFAEMNCKDCNKSSRLPLRLAPYEVEKKTRKRVRAPQ